MQVRSDELIWVIRGKYLSSGPVFYAIINQHEIYDKKVPNLITPKNY